MTDARDILLHGENRELRIPASNVYFAFASGRLAYDCVTCGSKCCRGYGYALDGEQALHQLTRRPTLRFFVQHNDGRNATMKSAPPGCFFLDTQGRCEIQAESGHDAKPETCRLFPFNKLYRLGDYLIVAPHESLCPLGVAALGHESRTSDHASLVAEMSGQGVRNRVPPVGDTTSNGAGVIALERRIVELSEMYHTRRYPEFIAAQQALTSPDATDVTVLLNGMCILLEIDRADLGEENTDVDVVMTALTPILRARVLFGERPDGHARVDQNHIPRHLLATYVLTCLAHKSGMKEITYQTVSRIAREFHELIALLGDLERVVMWQSDTFVLHLRSRGTPKFETAYLGIARALTAGNQQRNPRTLGDIILEHMSAHGVDRVRFLRILAGRLNGRLTSLDESLRRTRLDEAPCASRGRAVGRGAPGCGNDRPYSSPDVIVIQTFTSARARLPFGALSRNLAAHSQTGTTS